MKKIFTNDQFFLGVIALSIIGAILNASIAYFSQVYTAIFVVSDLARIICLACLYFSYQKHTKNVMKGMMGALLMHLFMDAVLSISKYGTDWITLVYIFVAALLFLNHFVINASHEAKPVPIAINRVLCLIYVVDMVIGCRNAIINAPMFILKVAYIFSALASVGVGCAIVCVESRLDSYRIDRQAAGWTEEKGYPEGYVHEFEKNKEDD